jgi:MinD-like ATPase involved in chromosome partitioning or flagellar assembly
LADNEQDWPADPGPAEHADAPASSPGEDSSTGPAHPSWGRSVWADMLISGPGDSEHGGFGPDGFGPDSFGPDSFGPDSFGPGGSGPGGSRPYGAGDPGCYGAGQRRADGRPREDAPSWPSSGLPPSFGQRPVAGERPDFDGAGLPPPGPADAGMPESGWPGSLAPDVPQARGWSGTEAAFGPWETSETETRYEPAVGYGVVPGPEPVRGDNGVAETSDPPGADDGTYGSYGVVPPVAEAPPRYPEEPTWQGVSADSLSTDVLMPGRHAGPPSGWRRTLYQITAGRVRALRSTADRRHMDLVLRARTPVAAGHHRVAVLSLKGGVGKTTTTVGLGSTLASLRGDRVIAIDANPDRGTLCDKLRLETAATVRDLLNEGGQIRRYADVRAYTTQAPSGLEVLASDRDPTVSVAFSDEDYEDVVQVLEHHYSICITDCGTGLLHSAMAGVLHLADQIVLVSSPSVDGARSASATLDWLAAHQYGDLVRGAVVVLSAIRPRSKSTLDLGRLEQHFAARCRAVVRVPYDAHLEEGAEIDLDQLSRATTDAYLVLAAEVGDGFARPRH